MRIRLVAALLAVVATATACGQGPAAAPPLPPGVTVRGDATVAMPRPASLDPASVVDASGEMVVRAMCDPLLGVDPQTGELIPALVQSWIVTDGGNRVVLRLRDGLRFPDGSAVTARDVVFSLSRASSAAFAGPNADLLRGIRGHRVLRGQDEADEPRHRREYEGIRILSATAFELNLDVGAQAVLPQLAHPVASILSQAQATEDPARFAAQPMCVGPYRASQPFDADAATWRIDRVEGYGGFDDAHAAGGQGFLESITFTWTPTTTVSPPAGETPSPEVASPTFDAFDVVLLDEGQLRATEGSSTHQVVLSAAPTAQYLGIPDAQVGVEGRRALSLALDRMAIAEVLGATRSAPLTAFLPPSLGTFWHRPSACPDGLSATSDRAAARQVARDAGLSLGGVTLRLVTNPDFDNVALLEEVARQWRLAFPGFNPVVEAQPWEDFRRGFEDPDGFDDAFRTSNRVPFPSPFAWLAPLRTAEIGTANGVAHADGLFDELVELEAARATDPVDQRVVMQAAEDRLCASLPILPLVHGQRAWSISKDLAHATGGAADLADSLTGGIRLRDLHRP